MKFITLVFCALCANGTSVSADPLNNVITEISELTKPPKQLAEEIDKAISMQLVKMKALEDSNRAADAERVTKNLYNSTKSLLESLGDVNKQLSASAITFRQMSEVTSLSNPSEKKFGFNLEARLTKLTNELIDKKIPNESVSGEKKAIKEGISAVFTALKNDFPIVNTVATAISVLASYRKQDIEITTGFMGNNPKVSATSNMAFSKEDIASIIAELKPEMDYFRALNGIHTKYVGILDSLITDQNQYSKELIDLQKSLDESFSNAGDRVFEAKDDVKFYSKEAANSTVTLLNQLARYETLEKNYKEEVVSVLEQAKNNILGADVKQLNNSIELLSKPVDGVSSIWSPKLKKLRRQVEKTI